MNVVDVQQISEDALPTLFEPFKRTAAARTGEGGALGIGLFILREIVETHGGDTAVRTPDGKAPG